MAGRDDGDDKFGKLFGSFFGPGMDDHFKDLTRQMDEMFQNLGFGDVNISGGSFPLPPAPGGKPPGIESPRDQMLKDPAGPPSQIDPTSISRQPFQSPFRFPSFPRPDFNSPYDNSRIGEPNPLSGRPAPTEMFSSSWSSTSTSSSSSTGSGWNKRMVQTVRHRDGTVERIEKSTENGRTCTTTTTTDPHGVTTTNTVCDRPPLDGPPFKGSPLLDGQNPGSRPVKPYSPSNSEYSKEDVGFFKKLFGFDAFKPKD